uniref:Uncharacterized protein n=1 Tax=Arundo donax TaxID=35708 RepID=A0A0A9C724_ARUDO
MHGFQPNPLHLKRTQGSASKGYYKIIPLV